MKHQTFKRAIVFAALATCGFAAQAADWSDTSLSYRYGTKFAEPFGVNDITKNIVNLTHVSGYKYGTNFFSADFLLSDKKDPSSATSTTGAQEAYVVYRHTLDLGKLSGKDFKFGIVRGVGATAGFDWNTKTDAGYNSKKRMLVAGPTLMLDVPGFLNVSLLELWESNNPSVSDGAFNPGYPKGRYSYDPHPMLTAAWDIPFSLGPVALTFEGFANFIASKGKSETGADTAAETNIDAQIMYDASSIIGAGKKTFKVGVEYQWWKNKFGNDSSMPGTGGNGAFAKTPMVRAEYHF